MKVYLLDDQLCVEYPRHDCVWLANIHNEQTRKRFVANNALKSSYDISVSLPWDANLLDRTSGQWAVSIDKGLKCKLMFAEESDALMFKMVAS